MVESNSNLVIKEVKYKSFTWILFNTINSCWGSFLFGYENAVFNSLDDYFKQKNNWSGAKSDFFEGLITGIMPLGAMIGCLVSTYVFNHKNLGRIKTFYLLDFLSIIILCLQLIDNLVLIIIMRFLIGIVIGINTTLIPTYISEISPKELSGKLGSFVQTFVGVGIIATFFLNFGVPNNYTEGNGYWRFMFGIPIIFVVLRSVNIFLFFSKETPLFLLKNNREEEALESLKIIYKEEHFEESFEELKIMANTFDDLTFKELTRNYRTVLLIAIFLNVLQQFCGINAVIFYSNKIFDNITDSKMTTKLLTLSVGAINLISPFIAGLFIDKLGRKVILIIGEAICALTLGILCISSYFHKDIVSIVFILLFIYGFGVSLGIIIWIYIPETLPEKGISLGLFVNFLCTGIVGISFPSMESQLGISKSFVFFFAFTFVGLIISIVFIKETKGKRPEELKNLYRN